MSRRKWLGDAMRMLIASRPEGCSTLARTYGITREAVRQCRMSYPQLVHPDVANRSRKKRNTEGRPQVFDEPPPVPVFAPAETHSLADAKKLMEQEKK